MCLHEENRGSAICNLLAILQHISIHKKKLLDISFGSVTLPSKTNLTKEGNPDICCKMDRSRRHYSK